MHFLLNAALIFLVWVLIDLLVVLALSARRPTPRHKLPDYLRRAL